MLKFTVVCKSCNAVLEAEGHFRTGTGAVVVVEPCDNCPRPKPSTRIIEVFDGVTTKRVNQIDMHHDDIPAMLEKHRTMTFGFYKVNGDYRELTGHYTGQGGTNMDRMYVWDKEADTVKGFYLNRLEQIKFDETTINVI